MFGRRPLAHSLGACLVRHCDGNSAPVHFRTQTQPNLRRFRDGSQTAKFGFWDDVSGYLGADPVLRYTSSDWSVAKTSGAPHGALDRSGRDGSGHTEWHRVVAWGNLTEVDGVERSAYEVIANEVLFLDRAQRQKPEDAAPPVGGDDNPF
jgi:Single-strand binding protein family